LLSLIAIVTLIESCAAPIKLEPIVVDYSKLKGLNEIDPKNPPKDGVWMSWPDATSMAVNQRNQRLGCQEKDLQCQKEIAKLNLANEQLEKQIKTDIRASWWYNWAFPIGILTGFIVGAVVPIAVMGGMK